MMRNVGASDWNRIVLGDPPNKPFNGRAKAPQPTPAASAHVGKAEINEIVNVASFDGERAVHVGFSESKIGIQDQMRNDTRVYDPDRYGWRAGPNMVCAAIGRDHSQCAFADNLAEQPPQ
jgi:hypothetical protein